MMARRVPLRVVCLMLCMTLFTPALLRAQASDQKLSEIIPNLFFDTAVDELAALEAVFPGSLAFVPDSILRPRFETAFAMNNLMGMQVSGFPLGSSGGGFSWTFDPAVGTFNRASGTFGPVFTERALTVGRRRMNFGVNYQRSTFDKLEGKSLADGDVKLYTGFTTPGVTAFFEDSFRLKLTTDTVGLFAMYGVTDRFDVGVAVPIIHVDMEAALDFTATVRFGASASTSELFVGTPVTGSATGIGDIVVRTKYQFLRRQGGGLAAGVDLRLPTGDELDLLGAAGGQTKFYVAGSAERGRISPHVNFGFTVSGESDAAKSDETFVFAPSDEINFAGGVDLAVSPRLTLVGDLIGRTIRDTIVLNEAATPFGGSFRQFRGDTGNLNILLGSVGVKFNPMGQGLIAFNVLFPLNENGLTDNLTWLGGFEFSF